MAPYPNRSGEASHRSFHYGVVEKYPGVNCGRSQNFQGFTGLEKTLGRTSWEKKGGEDSRISEFLGESPPFFIGIHG